MEFYFPILGLWMEVGSWMVVEGFVIVCILLGLFLVQKVAMLA